MQALFAFTFNTIHCFLLVKPNKKIKVNILILNIF